MAQAGVNPHTAADLLRQAVAQNTARYDNMHRDDIMDHIGSNVPTPSGVETPRPDFQDKRMPGIIGGYFGQVGRYSSESSPLRSAQVISTADLEQSLGMQLLEEEPSKKQSRSSSASGSMVMVEREPPQAPTPPPDELAADSSTIMPHTPSAQLPPTPGSPTSAMVPRNGEVAENGMPMEDGGLASITQAIRNLVLPKSSFGVKPRRHQSLPVSHASKGLIAETPTSNPSPLAHSPHCHSPARSRSPEHRNPPSPEAGLTSNAAAESREKSTPPQTPRTLSYEGVQNARSPLSKATRSPEPITQTQEKTKPDESVSANVPTNVPRGKLAVKIAEGRGLRPSIDPYCICVFEWNEYISQGPKHDKMDVDGEESKGPVPKLASQPMRRTESDVGKPMAIPMRSRQSSSNGSETRVTDPQWDHEAIFDVVGRQSELDVSVYDRRTGQDLFIGHIRLCLNLSEQHPLLEGWFPLEKRAQEDEGVSGEVYIKMHFTRSDKRHYGPNDFQILKLIGKGTFGQVYQVRKKDTGRIYAMKVLSKKVIIQKKEVAHTLGERNILVRTATADSAFIVGLKFSFQTPTDLYLVTDFMSGGELFWHLQKEGRFKEDRAKFYIAELILALKHLHEHDIVYRDLKPENILLDANGHIALCDFGLSKANLTKNDTTNTFCGTTEYLAPEVLLDEHGYTKMVDFWSLGVLVFEMCCGWSPFYAEDTQQMYKNIAFGKVRFPRDALSTEGRNFVKGLLNRNPKHRLGANSDAKELMEHPFFADVDWVALGHKNLVPPFKPKLSSVADTSNFDPEFTNALNTSSSLNARAAALAAGADTASTPLSPTMQNAFRGFTFVDESTLENQLGGTRSGEDKAYDDTLNLIRSRTKENRMSGIQHTSSGDRDEGFFNNENWEMS